VCVQAILGQDIEGEGKGLVRRQQFVIGVAHLAGQGLECGEWARVGFGASGFGRRGREAYGDIVGFGWIADADFLVAALGDQLELNLLAGLQITLQGQADRDFLVEDLNLAEELVMFGLAWRQFGFADLHAGRFGLEMEIVAIQVITVGDLPVCLDAIRCRGPGLQGKGLFRRQQFLVVLGKCPDGEEGDKQKQGVEDTGHCCVLSSIQFRYPARPSMIGVAISSGSS